MVDGPRSRDFLSWIAPVNSELVVGWNFVGSPLRFRSVFFYFLLFFFFFLSFSFSFFCFFSSFLLSFLFFWAEYQSKSYHLWLHWFYKLPPFYSNNLLELQTFAYDRSRARNSQPPQLPLKTMELVIGSSGEHQSCGRSSGSRTLFWWGMVMFGFGWLSLWLWRREFLARGMGCLTITVS